MSTDKKAESEVTRTVIEETAATGGGTAVGLAVGALVGGPVGAAVGAGAGAVTTVFVKGLFARTGEWARERADRRIQAFEHEIGEAVMKSTPDGPAPRSEDLAWIAQSEAFSEVVFQNYRRAIDALDPSVVPALARLTWLYKGRSPDAFFRSWGRLLEELSAEEFHALREIISAVVQYDAPCKVVPWMSQGRNEMRLSKIPGEEPVMGFVPGAGTRRALALIEAHDLAYKPNYARGSQIAMSGNVQMEPTTCKRVLYVVGATTVILFPAKYDREPLKE